MPAGYFAVRDSFLLTTPIGAKEEGILRYHMLMRDGRYRDSVCFSIIAPEWHEVKAALKAKWVKPYESVGM